MFDDWSRGDLLLMMLIVVLVALIVGAIFISKYQVTPPPWNPQIELHMHP